MVVFIPSTTRTDASSEIFICIDARNTPPTRNMLAQAEEQMMSATAWGIRENNDLVL